jgi:hypothetical protein
VQQQVPQAYQHQAPQAWRRQTGPSSVALKLRDAKLLREDVNVFQTWSNEDWYSLLEPARISLLMHAFPGETAMATAKIIEEAHAQEVLQQGAQYTFEITADAPEGFHFRRNFISFFVEDATGLRVILAARDDDSMRLIHAQFWQSKYHNTRDDDGAIINYPFVEKFPARNVNLTGTLYLHNPKTVFMVVDGEDSINPMVQKLLAIAGRSKVIADRLASATGDIAEPGGALHLYREVNHAMAALSQSPGYVGNIDCGVFGGEGVLEQIIRSHNLHFHAAPFTTNERLPLIASHVHATVKFLKYP